MDVQPAVPTSGATDGAQPASQSATGVVQPSQTAPAPSSATQGSGSQAASTSGIASAVAKLYNVGSGASGQPALDVSYRVVPGLDLVVTVFTNSETGQEVAQFPPEVLVGVAQFFDQLDGVTLDQKV